MHSLLAFVDKIYCINLDSRPDRWEDVQIQFDRLGIAGEVHRVSGIVDDDPRIGCLESHIACVDDAVRNRFDNILICEDDVVFYPYEASLISEAVSTLKMDSGWDLFYLGGMVMSPARFVSRHVFKARFFSTHSYIINKRAFDKVYAATPPIDIWYAWNMVSYGLYPMLATQAETFSDIRKQVIKNRENSFTRRYELLVEPNLLTRWVNYFRLHYLRKYFPFKK